ncbi:MAG: hypothetical protein ACYCWE_05320 [Eubacteriales bacterium]
MKKLTAFFLLFIMLVFIFISCSDKNGEESESGILNTTVENPADNIEETETTRITADVPDSDFENYEFTIAAIGPDMAVYWAQLEIDTDSLNGEIINDSVYRRNSTIEEKFNIQINAHFTPDPAGAARKAIMADSDEFDLVSTRIVSGLDSLATGGLLLNLFSVPYIDLQKPWWDQNAVSQLSLANKLYVTASDLGYRDKEATWVFLFNKMFTENFKLDDPYELVRTKSWTFEKMYDMVKAATEDIDGNGIIDQNDNFGLVTQKGSAVPTLLAGAGISTVRKDENDLPYLSFMSEETLEVVTKIFDVLYDKNNTFLAENFKGVSDVWDAQLKIFGENHCLFKYTLMDRVLRLRQFYCDFGILPIPLMLEGQTEYYTPIESSCMSAVAIPVTVADEERTGIITEALTAESYYILIPSYYETAIKGKGLRDEESLEMLDIIVGNRLYDIGTAYDIGGINAMLNGMANSGKSDLASVYTSKEAAALKSIESFINKISSINN